MMGDNAPLASLGMSEEEMAGYVEELLRQQAAEVAAEEGSSTAKELDSVGFAATRAAMSYTIKLIAANNAFITRRLLDLGLLGQPDPAASER